MTEKDDNKDDFEEMVKKVNENPDYNVLTREEYEAIMAFVPAKTSTPIPHTGTDPVVKPKRPSSNLTIHLQVLRVQPQD